MYRKLHPSQKMNSYVLMCYAHRGADTCLRNTRTSHIKRKWSEVYVLVDALVFIVPRFSALLPLFSSSAKNEVFQLFFLLYHCKKKKKRECVVNLHTPQINRDIRQMMSTLRFQIAVKILCTDNSCKQSVPFIIHYETQGEDSTTTSAAAAAAEKSPTLNYIWSTETSFHL